MSAPARPSATVLAQVQLVRAYMEAYNLPTGMETVGPLPVGGTGVGRYLVGVFASAPPMRTSTMHYLCFHFDRTSPLRMDEMRRMDHATLQYHQTEVWEAYLSHLDRYGVHGVPGLQPDAFVVDPDGQSWWLEETNWLDRLVQRAGRRNVQYWDVRPYTPASGRVSPAVDRTCPVPSMARTVLEQELELVLHDTSRFYRLLVVVSNETNPSIECIYVDYLDDVHPSLPRRTVTTLATTTTPTTDTAKRSSSACVCS